MNNKTFIEANYEEVSNHNINGKPLYFNTTQVAEIIKEEPSTVRYWSKRFKDLLNIEVSNRNKQYKESDIEKLKFIKKLTREDGFTLTQVEEYANTKGFDIKDVQNAVMDRQDPLAIQAFTAAMMLEMDKKLDNFSEQLMSKIDNKLEQYAILQHEENEKMREITMSILDGIISDRLDISLKEFTNILQDKQDKNTAQYNKLIDLLEKNLENQSAQKKESLFTKLFKKKK